MSKLRSRAFWNPLDSTAGYVIPHLFILVLLGLVIFLVGFVSGWDAGTKYTSAYFRSHYSFPGLKTPPPSVSAPIRDVHPVGLGPTGSIQTGYYPSTGDQGPLGECAGYASAWDASFELREHGGFGWVKLSPIYEYSYYSDTYTGGQDAGSWPDQDLELLSSTGLPRFSQVPTPPYQILNPLPTTDANGNPLRMVRTPYQIHIISGFAQGGGQGAVDAARAAIAANHPVMWALPVYPEYDNATSQPLIVSPQPGEVSRGGHANVLLKYDDTKVFPDGTVGGFLTRNQWSTQWGIKGNAWVSYDFVRRFSFGLEYLTIGAAAPHASGPATHFVPNHAPKHSIVPKGYNPPPSAPSTTAWRVKGVYTHDTHVSLDAALNYWGTKYNVWPVGLAAVAATESGINQYADRCCIPGDTSYGLMQFTLGTACGYGICTDIRNRLDDPSTSIYMAARYLSDAQKSACVPFPWIYVAYNEGSGLGCGAYEYTHPTGQAATNFYGNFLPNYNYVIATYSDYGPPPPPPTPKPKPSFPIKHWGKKVSAYWHGGISMTARYWWNGRTAIGTAVSSTWVRRPRHGYQKTIFVKKGKAHTILCWPSYGKCKLANGRLG